MNTVPNRPDSRFRWPEYPEYPVKKRVQGTVPPFAECLAGGSKRWVGVGTALFGRFPSPLATHKPETKANKLFTGRKKKEKKFIGSDITAGAT